MQQKLTAVLRRRWLLLVLFPVLAAGAVWLVSPSGGGDAQQYRATQTIVRRLDTGSSPGGFESTAQAALYATTGRVPEVAAQQLGYEGDPEVLADAITIVPDDATFALGFSTEADDPETATARVDAFVQAFLAVQQNDANAARQDQIATAQAGVQRAQQQLDAFIAANADIVVDPETASEIQAQQQRLEEQLASFTATLQEVQAQPDQPELFTSLGPEPAAPVEDPPLRIPADRTTRAALTLPLGVLLAAGLIAVLERIQPRIDTAREAEEALGYPVIARIPRERAGLMRSRRPSIAGFTGPYAEAHRALRSSIDFAHKQRDADRPPRVLVASALAGEGKSNTSTYLALAYAEADLPSTLVDADLRRPSIHRLFGVDRVPGLVSLAHQPGLRPRGIARRSGLRNLVLVTSGEPTSVIAPVLGPIADTIDWVSGHGSAVIVDTSPMLAANDAIDLVPLVDWVVLVVRAGQTTVRAVDDVSSLLARHQAPLLGCVLVGALPDPGAPYYDYYGVSGRADPVRPQPPGGGTADPSPFSSQGNGVATEPRSSETRA